MAEAEATFEPETGRISLRIAAWDDSFPADQLERWIAFYRRQRAGHVKSGSSYDATIAALEALRDKVPPTGQ